VTPEQERREIARRAAAVLACSVDAIEDAAREVERETGHKVLRRRPQMSDATRGDLEELLAQVRAAEEALTLALQWVGLRDRLGSVLKRMPKAASVELAEKLRQAGLNV
jgi:hypothetical protein